MKPDHLYHATLFSLSQLFVQPETELKSQSHCCSFYDIKKNLTKYCSLKHVVFFFGGFLVLVGFFFFEEKVFLYGIHTGLSAPAIVQFKFRDIEIKNTKRFF